jgi:AmpD protein
MRRNPAPGGGSEFPEVDPVTGRIAGARQLVSPNCDDRPAGTVIDLVVVHGISLPPGEFGGPWIDAMFTNTLPPDTHEYFAGVATLAGVRACADPAHRRDRAIRGLQPACVARRPLRWQGRADCNDYSIGIELEGTDATPYATSQYVVLSRVVSALCRAYPGITLERVVGHSDVAPGRKTDPGIAFDWPLLRTLVRYELEVAPP